jgi:tyrosyl-tRNA synthetase
VTTEFSAKGVKGASSVVLKRLMRTNFIEELKWRNMLHDATPGTEKLLMTETVKGYIGFDPTADSLGVGNLVQVMMLLHFQRAGHIPVALVGGATGMVGDPSGKSAERNLLSEDVLLHNLESQKKQLAKFLDFTAKENAASIVNNYDWFKGISFLEFIRDVGKFITVNSMLAKDSVKNRISGEEREGMSFTEFSYQLVQGYDFFHLWKNQGVKLQMGGSDQWGNMTTGTELIRKKAQGEAFALTTPLIAKADGTKFGKTENGNVWLDSKRTSPYEFLQFWLNASDADAANYIRIFTLLTKEEVVALEAEQLAAPHLRALQKKLAQDVTSRVHGADEFHAALGATELLFGKGTIDSLRSLSDEKFESLFLGAGVKVTEIAKGNLLDAPILDVLTEKTGFLSSKGEAKKLLEANGFSINKEKFKDLKGVVTESMLINGRFVLLQKGKKDYALLKVI